MGWAAVSLFFRELLSPQFISVVRAFRRRPVLSLDFLINSVLEDVCPLDWAAVLASPAPLHVVTASIDSLSPVMLSEFH